MSDNQTGGQTGGGTGAAQGQPQGLLTVHTQYVRDLSFENPNAPQIYAQMKTQPQVDLRIELPIRRIQERLFELGLKFTLNAKVEQHTAFVVELDYAGLMSVGDHVQEDEVEAVLAIDGARMLFPFARRVVSDVVRDGGFPPVMIGSLDFAKLYQQRKAQGQTGQATAAPQAPAAAPTPGGQNA